MALEPTVRYVRRKVFGEEAVPAAPTTSVTPRLAAPAATNATVNRELAILKRAFRLAEQAGKTLHRPYIPMLAENNTRTGFFERDEFEDVRQHLPAELRGVVTFAYCTGWRTGEILPLSWVQVDRAAKTARLESGSTKTARRGRSPTARCRSWKR